MTNHHFPGNQEQPVPPQHHYGQPPYPQQGWGQPHLHAPYPPPQGLTRGTLMRWAGGAVGLAVALFFVGMVILGIGSTKRRYREVRALGAFAMLVSAVPGLVGGGLFVAGAMKTR